MQLCTNLVYAAAEVFDPCEVLGMYKTLAFLLLVLLSACTTEHTPERSPTATKNITNDLLPETLKWNDARNSVLLLLPLSGSNAAIGQNIINACLLASQGSKDVDFHVVDTARIDPAMLYEQTKYKKFKAVIGPDFCNEVRQYESIFGDVPIFALSNNTDINNQHVIACGLSPLDELKIICEYIRKEKMKGVLFLMPDTPYADRIVTLARKMLPKMFDNDEVDVIKYNKISKEDALKAAQSSRQAIFILEPILDIDELPTTKRVFTLSASALSNKSAWNGVIFAFEDNRRKAFIKHYQKIFKKVPTAIDLAAYDLVGAICASTARNMDFFGTNFQGCLGEFALDKKHGMRRKLHLFSIIDSQEIPLENSIKMQDL